MSKSVAPIAVTLTGSGLRQFSNFIHHHLTVSLLLQKRCLCPPDSKIKYSVFYVYILMFMYYVFVVVVCLFVCLFLNWYLLCSRKANFYVIHRQ